MSEELEKILESLPEEERKSFIEKVKVQAQNAVKVLEENKKKEEEKKKFKASGQWETENDEFKASLEINSEDMKSINVSINTKDIHFALTKNEFFNFAKMVEDAYSSLKEDNEKPSAIEDSVYKYVRDIANRISDMHSLMDYPCRRGKIFHIR